ncbi:MAG: hypothetical protein HPY71_05625 [Firmicutes bacterium]|nr:hypothetical protein [Bacillota bacterium]
MATSASVSASGLARDSARPFEQVTSGSGSGFRPGPGQGQGYVEAVAGHRADLQRFVSDVIAAAGGVTETPSYALIHMALPEDLAGKFSLPEFAVLAFDYDVAKETPGAEFVTFGSPALDRFISLGSEIGRVTRKFAMGSAIRVPPNLMDRIESKVGFNRCRRPALKTTSIQAYERAVFQFVVSYISDEKFSDSLTVAIDSATLADDTGLLPETRGVFFGGDPQELSGVPVAERRPYGEVLNAALARLPERVRPGLAMYQADVSGFCQKELVKVLGFYEKTLADLAARGEAAAAAGDTEKKARIDAKIEASRLERQRRVSDVVNKYRMRVEARLDSVVLQVMPKVRALLDVRHKDRTYTQEVFYNLATSSVEPLTCPRCGRRFFSAYPAGDGSFVCRAEEAE